LPLTNDVRHCSEMVVNLKFLRERNRIYFECGLGLLVAFFCDVKRTNMMQHTLLNKCLLFMPWPVNAINCSNYAKERQLAVPHVVG
jgi:hypothetical protein